MRFLMILAFLIPVSAIAQPFQEQKFIGGALSFSANSTVNGDKSTSFSISPLIGKMVSNQMAVGGSLGLGFSKTTGEGNVFVDPITGQLSFSNNTSNSISVSINPFVSWYFPIKGNLGFNLLTGVGVGFNKREFELGLSTVENKSYRLSANVSPALYYFVSPNISLHATLGGLQFIHTTGKEIDNTTSFNFSIRSGSSFSIRYFWGGSTASEDDE